MKKEIINELRRSNPLALKILFDEYFEPLVKYAHGYIGDREASKDIVQQLFINIWSDRSRLKAETISSYLFVSVRNRSFSFLKSQKRTKEVEDDTLILEVNENDDDRRRLAALLESAIGKLPDKNREVFLLSKQGGLTYAEIAEELEISVKTVERHMGIALSKLREYMAPHKEYWVMY